MVKSLQTLDRATQGQIVHIDGDTSFSDRLKSLGFIPGSSVSLFAKAAFGGPLSFEIQNTKIALRREDAAKVMVSILD